MKLVYKFNNKYDFSGHKIDGDFCFLPHSATILLINKI